MVSRVKIKDHHIANCGLDDGRSIRQSVQSHFNLVLDRLSVRNRLDGSGERSIGESGCSSLNSEDMCGSRRWCGISRSQPIRRKRRRSGTISGIGGVLLELGKLGITLRVDSEYLPVLSQRAHPEGHINGHVPVLRYNDVALHNRSRQDAYCSQ